MIECGCSAGFAPETFQSLRVLRDVVRQKLQRDEAAQVLVFGFIDNPHPATAKLLDNAVMRDGLSDHGTRRHVMRGIIASQ
jgi:hypothetical protein